MPVTVWAVVVVLWVDHGIFENPREGFYLGVSRGISDYSRHKESTWAFFIARFNPCGICRLECLVVHWLQALPRYTSDMYLQFGRPYPYSLSGVRLDSQLSAYPWFHAMVAEKLAELMPK